jgi:cupin superfamily protein
MIVLEVRMKTSTFAEFIEPISTSEFLTCHRGRSPLYIPGSPCRYESLPKIQDLNRMFLSFKSFPGIFRMSRSQGPIPVDNFLFPIPNSNRGFVKAQAVERYLQAGATLVLESCESYLEGAYEVCDMLSKALLARVHAGLFLVYEPEQPCGVHWDNYDMFICQVAGSKKWPIYRPVHPNPIFTREPRGGRRKELELVEELTLRPGDLLYVPRGWPHNPAATEGPSMHISFAMATPTGADLLEWIRDDLSETSAEFRADLPLLLTTDTKLQFAAKLRELILERLSLDFIEQYCESYKSTLVPQPLALPELRE